MSMFTMKILVPDEHYEQEVDGQKRTVTIPAHEQVVSFDLHECAAVVDDGRTIAVILKNNGGQIAIPNETRDFFIQAWNDIKGCDIGASWKDKVGVAVYTKRSKQRLSVDQNERMIEIDPHAAEFLANLKEFQDKVKANEEAHKDIHDLKSALGQ